MRKGPLIIYGDKTEDFKSNARNLPGVDTCHYSRLNILQLAPGGHLGRFVIFTEDAFKALNGLFGSNKAECTDKKGYHINRTVMNCADISRIINSDQVQSKLREQRTSIRVHDKTKKNPLKNKKMMQKLNPWATKKAALIAKREEDRAKGRKAALKAKRNKDGQKAKKQRTARNKDRFDGLEKSFKDAEDVLAEEQRQGNYQPGDSEEEEGDE